MPLPSLPALDFLQDPDMLKMVRDALIEQGSVNAAAKVLPISARTISRLVQKNPKFFKDVEKLSRGRRW